MIQGFFRGLSYDKSNIAKLPTEHGLSLPFYVDLSLLRKCDMSTSTKDNTKMWWLIFVVSTAIMIMLLMFADMWFWLALPPAATALVKALKVM